MFWNRTTVPPMYDEELGLFVACMSWWLKRNRACIHWNEI